MKKPKSPPRASPRAPSLEPRASRQATSIQRIRYYRRTFGICRDCGQPSPGYRCERCNGIRREAMKLLMRRRRAEGKAS